MDYLISGIQQVGIGVSNVDEAWAWYRRQFGMDIQVFREAAPAPLMTPYTGEKVQSRDAVLALNLNGGGGMEIWQFTSRTPQPPSFEPALGDLGLYCARIKTRDIEAVQKAMQAATDVQAGSVVHDPLGAKHFFVRDPGGNLFDVVEGQEWFGKAPGQTGGPAGCLIGVSDIDQALPLYQGILDYDVVEFDETDSFEDWAGLPGSELRYRRVRLSHSKARKGPFSRLLGASKLELVQSIDRQGKKLFADRFWGDLGFIHLCFDVKGMALLKQKCEDAGFPFTVDSEDSFDMGAAGGRFSYIEDPDGTLIEFVETHKVPIMEKWGLYLNLQKRPPEKPLPDLLIKAFRLNRVR